MDPTAIARMNDFYKVVHRLHAMPEVLFVELPPGSGFADMAAIFGNVMSVDLINRIRQCLDIYENQLIIQNKKNDQQKRPESN